MTVIDSIPYHIAIAGVVFLLVLTVLLLLKAFIAGQLQRLASRGQLQFLNYPEQILNATRLPFMLGVSLLAAVSQLELTPQQEKWLEYAWIVILISQVALWANRAVTVAVGRAFERHRLSDPSGATYLMLSGLVARIALWSIAVLVTLDNLGFNITTLMASQEGVMNQGRGRVRARRDAVQGAARRTGWPPVQAPQRRNAPFSLEPGGQPREPAACGVAAPCRSTATTRRRALHSAGSRGCAPPSLVHNTL